MSFLKLILDLIVEWIKKRLKRPEAIPVEVPVILPEWYLIARKEIGQKEVVNGSNPRIIEYHMVTSLKATDDDIPWCSSFVSWVFENCDPPIKSSRSAWAKSYMAWGKTLDKPKVGCVCVFTRDKGGHVGFFVAEFPDSIMVLGGNQNNSVNISEYSKANLLGYRWPLGLD